jgi:hypothetical protein
VIQSHLRGEIGCAERTSFLLEGVVYFSLNRCPTLNHSVGIPRQQHSSKLCQRSVCFPVSKSLVFPARAAATDTADWIWKDAAAAACRQGPAAAAVRRSQAEGGCRGRVAQLRPQMVAPPSCGRRGVVPQPAHDGRARCRAVCRALPPGRALVAVVQLTQMLGAAAAAEAVKTVGLLPPRATECSNSIKEICTAFTTKLY